MVNKWLSDVLFYRVAGDCLLCEQVVPANQGLCDACDQAFPAMTGMAPPAGIDSLVAACPYAWPVDQLIGNFKYRSGITAGQVLSRRLARLVVPQLRCQPVHCMLPVPLHPRRYRSRGFNQAVEIARVLTQETGIGRLSAQRTSNDLPQAGRKAAERRRSRMQFEIGDDLAGMNVAIIDDVVTTGTTVRCLARQARQAGAERIEVWCLARASWLTD